MQKAWAHHRAAMRGSQHVASLTMCVSKYVSVCLSLRVCVCVPQPVYVRVLTKSSIHVTETTIASVAAITATPWMTHSACTRAQEQVSNRRASRRRDAHHQIGSSCRRPQKAFRNTCHATTNAHIRGAELRCLNR